jgi:ketosteroid isomerase-like protein
MRRFYWKSAKRKASTFVSWQPVRARKQLPPMPRILLAAIAVLGFPCFALQAESPAEALRAMVEAERQFYQTGQEQGTRAAFLAFLAEDGIVFRPGPVNGKEVWSKRPENGFDLVWEPTFAAIARSGDFGYDTGPAKWRAKKSDPNFDGHGHFVSIWKKQKDGAWKVALDCGIQHLEPAGKSDALRTVVPDGPGKGDAEFWAGAMKNFHEVAQDNSTKAISQFAAPEIRVYRDGHLPAVGAEAAHSLLSEMGGKTTYGPFAGAASSSHDLAYNYGKYTTLRAGSTEQGHYVQVWQTNSTGEWKLVVDWQQPLPKP